MHRQDPLGDLQTDRQLVGIGRLGQEVVGAGPQALEPVFPSIAGGQQDDVGVAFRSIGPDAPAELRAVEVRHHPVGDQRAAHRRS